MAKKAQKSSGSALDLAMAAFAGTAAGFVMFAMPDWQFNSIVELSGLPLVLSAAQPPLGTTARTAAIIAAALGTWTLVWLVLRALSKKPAAPKPRSKPVEIEVPLPRIRRADAHPDAPARRPIFAGLELGLPLDQEVEAEEAVVEESAQAEEAEQAEQAEEVQEEDAPAERPLPSFMMDPEEPEEAEAEEAPEAAEMFDSVALAAPAGDYEQSSISHLMQRLELGLLRREQHGWEGPAAETQQNNEASPKLDQRLRSAIDDLQRLAARGG
jgi:hypothetical protein